MSARYSNSPALHLRIADSPLRSLLLQLMLLLCLGSLWLLADAGYPLLACTLLVPTLWLLYFNRVQSGAVTLLQWQGGQWWLDDSGGHRSIELQPGPVGLPWLVCLCWRECATNRRGHLWVFADSLPPLHFRQLRVRLTLDSRA